MEITVFYRSDSSGTTWNFTNYLSKVSSEWRDTVGYGKEVAWPTGSGLKGNEGMAHYVKRVDGSIGYIDFSYVLKNKLVYTLLQNRAGNFVAPTIESFKEAYGNVDRQNSQGYYGVLTDQPGDNSWPIIDACFVFLKKKQTEAKPPEGILGFFDWCYKHGGGIAEELDYAPMSMNVVNLIKASWVEEVEVENNSVRSR